MQAVHTDQTFTAELIVTEEYVYLVWWLSKTIALFVWDSEKVEQCVVRIGAVDA